MLVITKEPFMKWVLDFARRSISNKYSLMIEQIMLPNGWRLRHSKPTLLLLQQNFLCEYILIRFGCPLTLVIIDQGV
jgi:hypothetical protein